ncbi:hypothetical protein RI367_004478 [Sorochytrium milnesiophthora]
MSLRLVYCLTTAIAAIQLLADVAVFAGLLDSYFVYGDVDTARDCVLVDGVILASCMFAMTCLWTCFNYCKGRSRTTALDAWLPATIHCAVVCLLLVLRLCGLPVYIAGLLAIAFSLLFLVLDGVLPEATSPTMSSDKQHTSSSTHVLRIDDNSPGSDDDDFDDQELADLLAHPSASSSTLLQQKLAKYERFINDKLRPDLTATLSLRDTVYDQLADYLKLRRQLEVITDNQLDELKTMVDLGSNFYVQAKVPDTRFVYVNVGFGFHVQFTLSEATAFIDRKSAHLEKLAQTYTDQANKVKAHIKLVLETVRELLQLDAEQTQQRRRHGELMQMAS